MPIKTSSEERRALAVLVESNTRGCIAAIEGGYGLEGGGAACSGAIRAAERWAVDRLGAENAYEIFQRAADRIVEDRFLQENKS